MFISMTTTPFADFSGSSDRQREVVAEFDAMSESESKEFMARVTRLFYIIYNHNEMMDFSIKNHDLMSEVNPQNYISLDIMAELSTIEEFHKPLELLDAFGLIDLFVGRKKVTTKFLRFAFGSDAIKDFVKTPKYFYTLAEHHIGKPKIYSWARKCIENRQKVVISVTADMVEEDGVLAMSI